METALAETAVEEEKPNELKIVGVRSAPAQWGAVRMLKLVSPSCKLCQYNGAADDWYTACPHDPYFIWKSKWSGRRRDEFNTEHQDTKRPRIGQFPLAIRLGTGKDPERAIARGSRHPEDFGYATICQYRNCYEPALYVTEDGMFCNLDQARLISADVQDVKLEARDGTERMRQLRGVTINVIKTYTKPFQAQPDEG